VDAVREQLRSEELAGPMGEMEDAIRRWDADPGARQAEGGAQPLMLDPQPG